MKTIEDMGREYQRSDESDGTTATAFIDGAEWMRGELTRWHDPKEVLPEDKEVLCKIDKRLNTYEVMRHDRHGWWMRAPIPEGGWCACDYDVIGWREIHE